MSGLDKITVTLESGVADWRERGNALPVLHEIRHGLERLASTGEATVIDLHAIPFGPGDEDRLLALLGRGEVQATLEALGTTRILETGLPAVWLVDHRNGDDERVALHIEIDRIPTILCTPTEDIADAIARLDVRLAQDAETRKDTP